MTEPLPPGRHAFDITADDVSGRLDLLVARHTGLSRTQAATLIATARVRVNGAQERASFRPEAGAHVEVDIPEPEGRAVTPEQIPVRVIFEDDELVVVDKPAGMVVHPAPGNWTGTLVNALMGRGQGLAAGGGPERAGLVHRLDKETSGLLVVAKTDRAHRVLSAAIAARRISRRYACLCWGHLDGDQISVDKPLGRDPNDRTRVAVRAEGGRTARTDFVRLARFQSVDLLRAHLHTGRTHQIRVHLASVGHPVVGDDTYGGGGGRRLMSLPPKRHFLHAAWLVFNHPVSGERLDVRSPLPEELRRSLAAAADDPSLFAHPDALEYLGFYRGIG
ncbi:MAG TPA: RluA family pseudouridine synthase [Gemmatimonadaceae bacterium]|nr:RluA family pseudouridine synthase [Gemmatimonadaceae bacterium]